MEECIRLVINKHCICNLRLVCWALYRILF